MSTQGWAGESEVAALPPAPRRTWLSTVNNDNRTPAVLWTDKLAEGPSSTSERNVVCRRGHRGGSAPSARRQYQTVPDTHALAMCSVLTRRKNQAGQPARGAKLTLCQSQLQPNRQHHHQHQRWRQWMGWGGACSGGPRRSPQPTTSPTHARRNHRPQRCKSNPTNPTTLRT